MIDSLSLTTRDDGKLPTLFPYPARLLLNCKEFGGMDTSAKIAPPEILAILFVRDTSVNSNTVVESHIAPPYVCAVFNEN